MIATNSDALYCKENLRTTKRRVKKAAAELYYPDIVFKKIDAAKTNSEVDRIMADARMGKYGKRL